MDLQKIPRSFGTHDGSFHADEVTACSLLLLFDLIDRDKILRSRQKDVLSSCQYVCDVGGVYDPMQLLFDHHQAEYQGPFSSAGMILLHLHQQGHIDKEEYEFFNRSLIKGVDEHDIGAAPQLDGYSYFSHVVSNFAPVEYVPDKEAQQVAFFFALDFVHDHLKRLFERFLYMRSFRPLVAQQMQQNQPFLLFEKPLPWLENFFALDGETHPAQFVVIPSGEHWNLRAIPLSLSKRMSVRSPLPKKWAGQMQENLQEISGISGAIFCHKGRFISVWQTKEDAMRALQYTLKHTPQEKI